MSREPLRKGDGHAESEEKASQNERRRIEKSRSSTQKKLIRWHTLPGEHPNAPAANLDKDGPLVDLESPRLKRKRLPPKHLGFGVLPLGPPPGPEGEGADNPASGLSLIRAWNLEQEASILVREGGRAWRRWEVLTCFF